jgi:hypothetical protein
LQQDPNLAAARLLNGAATAGATVGRDLAEADYWRLIDALILIATCPAASD